MSTSLKALERDILDIGDEQVIHGFHNTSLHISNFCSSIFRTHIQRLLFNRLRFFIDYHQITKSLSIAEREILTNQVRDELANHNRANPGDIRPKHVQIRPNEEALLGKYCQSATSPEDGYSSGNSVSNDVKIEPTSSGSDDEKIEILVEPDDIQIEQKVYSGPRQKSIKMPIAGQSLLKPIHQRQKEEVIIRVVRPETGMKKSTEPQPLGVSLGRLRLAQALDNAKKANKVQSTPKIESPETLPSETTELTVKCTTPVSSSQSSSGSSPEIEPVKDEETPDELGQETFLRLFNLYTPAHAQYLMNRRPSRKTRKCRSTERNDYLYGKYELFERQFANKRPRQFLYSPPATRAKRRVASNGTAKQQQRPAPAREPCTIPKKNKSIKSNASSSSSISSNGSRNSNSNSTEKVCLTCYERSKSCFFLTHLCIHKVY